MPGWLTDAEMTKEVEGALKQSPLSADFWPQLIKRANNSAYWCIVGALVPRGYTKAQVDTWDRGLEFQRDIGLFMILSAGGAADPENFNAKLLATLDRRKELETVELTAAGVLLTGAGTSDYGTGGYTTDNDVFVFPDVNDSNLGETTEF